MKLSVLAALTVAAISFPWEQASSAPISSDAAHAQCWSWTYHMDNKTSVCGYCEATTGRPKCHFYACDQTGCDTVTVEKRSPRDRWRLYNPAVTPRRG